MKAILYALFLTLSIHTLVSCSNKEETKGTKTEVKLESQSQKTVHVYFFEGFNKTIGNNTISELRQTFDSVSFEGVIPFPDSAYYAPRNRYKADKLVKHLRQRQTSSELVVGFSPKDISGRVHGYDDFGVMGWTRVPLHSAVVSTYRLGDKSRLQIDFVKLVLHELGHADGLPHVRTPHHAT